MDLCFFQGEGSECAWESLEGFESDRLSRDDTGGGTQYGGPAIVGCPFDQDGVPVPDFAGCPLPGAGEGCSGCGDLKQCELSLEVATITLLIQPAVQGSESAVWRLGAPVDEY